MAAGAFRVGRLHVELVADGSVQVHLGDTSDPWLSGAGLLRDGLEARPLVAGPPEVRADVDEVELAWSDERLSLVVRHTFVGGWGLRVALANRTAGRLTLDDPVLTWPTASGRASWALAAGASGSYAVLPPHGTGPVLGGVLRQGVLSGADAGGLHLGPVVLAPHGRYVVAWQWDLHASPRLFDRGRHPEVPRQLDLTAGDAVLITATEDEALDVGDGVGVDTVRGQQELTALWPGRPGVELASARGLTRYQLRIAAPAEEVLAGCAAHALRQPRTSSGVVRLPDVDAALAVQRTLAVAGRVQAGLVGAGPAGTGFDEAGPVGAELAAEALDLVAARLPEDDALEPRTIGFLCGEHGRTGDPELLDRAERAVLAATGPAAGLGMAATELCLALLLAGRPVGGVLEHLAALAAAAALPPAATPVDQQAALLELEVVTMARVEPAAGRRGPSTPALQRVGVLGGWLGAGLKGRPVVPLPVDRLAHLAAVLALLPEAASAELRSAWGCSAHELARRARSEVLNRVGAGPAGPAHSWLVLGSRPG